MARRALAALLIFAAFSASPQRTDLDRLRGDITRLKARLEGVRRQAQSAARELEEVELELGIRTRELELAAAAEERLRGETAATESQIAALVPRIERQRDDLRKRLVALYRLGGLSYVRMFLALDEDRNPLEAMSMLSYLVTRDARLVTRFQSAREQLALRRQQLMQRQADLQRSRQVVEQRRLAVIAARTQQQTVLARLRRRTSRMAPSSV